jgi:hypothetical protein
MTPPTRAVQSEMSFVSPKWSVVLPIDTNVEGAKSLQVMSLSPHFILKNGVGHLDNESIEQPTFLALLAALQTIFPRILQAHNVEDHRSLRTALTVDFNFPRTDDTYF